MQTSTYSISISISISIGLTCARPGDRLQQLLRRADTHLYGAKTQGHNRIRLDS
ncbi:diguanylate cyclase domain-containing protein [Pseudomonas sp. EA_35y_Pfl2_R111]|uniref:diguanylate cyclase domain-containing protein n=1 Tax=Pseudomonas sp. EA_35y_Pfl2_R111 TaxID=3088689 RepID=UPI00403F3F64